MMVDGELWCNNHLPSFIIQIVEGEEQEEEEIIQTKSY
jgi:hypothetical protein